MTVNDWIEKFEEFKKKGYGPFFLHHIIDVRNGESDIYSFEVDEKEETIRMLFNLPKDKMRFNKDNDSYYYKKENM